MTSIETCEFTDDTIQSCPEFDGMNLKDDILRGIYAHGFEKPSPIQQRAIVPLINGVDLFAQAQSGTGKTGTFAIAILQRIGFEAKPHENPQALILVPTRELAQQIKKVIDEIGSYCKINVHACIGGTNIMEDINALRSGQHIVVGTPGRIYDMISRTILTLANLKMLILDEADQMLDRGFQPQIYEIFKCGISKTTQIGLFSATWTKEAEDIATLFMNNPIKIEVKKERITLDGIKQYKIILQKDEFKFGVLVDLYKAISIKQAIIYCNNKKKVEEVASKLKENGLSMIYLHGEMSQQERDKIMREFRSGTTRILITTDLLARGIDIQQVSLVINYDIPNNKENYIHRIGRTGRFGRKGIALNFVSDKENQLIADIEAFYTTVIDELPGDLAGVFDS
jgi:translation initiation factor 4A